MSDTFYVFFIFAIGILGIFLSIWILNKVGITNLVTEDDETSKDSSKRQSTLLTTIKLAKEDRVFPISSAIAKFSIILEAIKLLKEPKRFQAETTGNSIYTWYVKNWKLSIIFNTDAEPIRLSIENIGSEPRDNSPTQNLIL